VALLNNNTLQQALTNNIQDGCATNVLLNSPGHTNIQNEINANFIKEDEWQLGNKTIKKLNDFQYSINGVSKESVGSSVSLKDSFYASGDLKNHSASIWNKLNNEATQICLDDKLSIDGRHEAFKSLFAMATVQACIQLGLHKKGLIAKGYDADLLLVKKTIFNYENEASFLQSLFLHGSKVDVSAVFKSGILIYSTPEFSDIYNLAKLSMYYNTENLPVIISPSLGFATIEKAIEDFSKLY
jgi:hypothetical protein